jgi:ferritin heavy chain
MSLCRLEFSTEVEQALNTQLNAELSASQTYLAMAAYFQRDTVALPGLAHFFMASSHEVHSLLHPI